MPHPAEAARARPRDAPRPGAGLYNRCWDLMEIEDRTIDQDDELLATAYASAWHWRQVGPRREPAPAATGWSAAGRRRCSAGARPPVPRRAGASRSSRPAARGSRTGTRAAAVRGDGPRAGRQRRPGGRGRVEGAGRGRACRDPRRRGPRADRGRPRHDPRLAARRRAWCERPRGVRIGRVARRSG